MYILVQRYKAFAIRLSFLFLSINVPLSFAPNPVTMKKNYYVLLLALLFAIPLISQNDAATDEAQQTPNEAVWIEMMQDENANFYETVDAFNKYWENRPDRKGSGYNPFKRWEWYMSHKIYPDGSRKAPGHDHLQYKNFLEAHTDRSMYAGNWVNIGPIDLPSSPYDFWGNGRINAIAFHPSDPDLFYIGAPAGGLWKTTDGGQHWETLTDNQPTLGVSAIIIDYVDPDIIYLGTGDRDAGDAAGLGVYKSTDGGITFFESNTNMGAKTVGRMIQHPTNPALLYAATSGGVYKSIDAGASWTLTKTGNSKEIVFHATDPNIIFCSVGSKFFKSVDAGDSWTMITNGTPTSGSRSVIAVSPDNPYYVYFFVTTGSAYYGTYLSIDGGESFTLRSNSPNVMGWACNGGAGGQAWYDLDIAADPNDADVLYAGGINCWRSADAGQTWTMSSNQTGGCGADAAHADLHVLEYNPLNDILYVGNDGGIWWNDDDGQTWTRITNGLAIGQQYKLGQSRLLQNHVSTGYQDNGISSYHTDEWIQSDMYADGMETQMDVADTSLSYGCAQYGNMIRMIDDKVSVQIAGEGVNGINEQGNWVTPFTQHESNQDYMFAGYINLWRTTNLTDNSPSWTKISSGVGNGSVTVVEHSPANENLFYFATSGNGLVRSDNIMDAVPAYADLRDLLPGSGAVNDIEAHPWDEELVYITQASNIYRSTDKGVSWEDISLNLPDINLNDVAYYDRGQVEGLYVGTNVGVFFKDAHMSEWILFSEGLPAAILVSEIEIYVDPEDPAEDRIRASSYGRGLWGSPAYYYDLFADFEPSERNIPLGCAIDFTDMSVGYPHSWSWTFEGGTPSTSTESNPSGIVYDAAGEFAVTLEVTNPDGSHITTKTAYIIVVDGLLPQVNFYSNDTAQCANEPIHLYDESTACPTGWLWAFDPPYVDYLEGTDENSQHPVVTLQQAGTYSVSLTVTNSSGESELIKEDYLNVGGQFLPYYENFSGPGFESMGCVIENPDQSYTWELKEVMTAQGMKQVSWINMFNYSNMNERDFLILPNLNFDGFDNVFMTFDYAYAQRYAPSDSLFVSISDDCGESWTRVYGNGPNGEGIFATSEPTTDSFEPMGGQDWCGSGYGADCPLIDLSNWAGQANIKLRFESFTRFSNNLYIGDVEISNSVGHPELNASVDLFELQPNPATDKVLLKLKDKGTYTVQIWDSRTHLVQSHELNQAQIELDVSQLKPGIYFVGVSSETGASTQKLVIQ